MAHEETGQTKALWTPMTIIRRANIELVLYGSPTCTLGRLGMQLALNQG